jgi:ribosome biogenesis protein YTM1
MTDKVQVQFYHQNEFLQPLLVPVSLKRSGLSQIINHLLSTEKPYDFIINNQFLRSSLAEYCESHSISLETILKIEYVELQEPKRQTQTFTQQDWISCLTINDYMISGSYDGSITVSDMSNVVLWKENVGQPIKAMTVVEDLIIAGMMDGSMYGYTYANGLEHVVSFQGHTLTINAIACNSKYIVSGGWDKQILVWERSSLLEGQGAGARDGRTGKSKKRKTTVKNVEPAFVLDGHSACISSLRFAQEDLLISGSWDHSLRFWTVDTQTNIKTINVEKTINSICCFRIDKNTLSLITGHEDGSLILFQFSGESNISFDDYTRQSRRAHGSLVSCIEHLKEFQFVTAGLDGLVRVFDTRSLNWLYTLNTQPKKEEDEDSGVEVEQSKVLCLAVKGPIVACGTTLGKIHIFQ